VSTTGIAKDMYILSLPNGGKSDVIERWFGRHVEAPMAPVFKKLWGCEILTASEISSIFSFVAIQKVRVPAQREAQRGHVKNVLRATDKDVPNLFLQSLVRLAPQIAEQLIELNVCLQIAPLGYSYITSDNPFVVMREREDRWFPEPLPEFSRVNILSQKGAKGFMPLTPKVCLFAEGKGRYRGYTDDNVPNVNSINRWVAFQSQRFLYAAGERDLRQVVWVLDH